MFLVAESDASIRSLISGILQAKGLGVVEASTLTEAVACLDRREPDGIMAAWQLDDGPGRDLLTETKRRGYAVPFIAIVDNGSADPGMLVRAGAINYVTKPVQRDQLEMAVFHATEMREHMRRERRLVQEASLSRHFLGTLLESGDEGIFLLNADEVLLEANPTGATMLQLPTETIQGKEYFTMLSAMSAGLQRDALEKARSTGQPQRIEEYRGGAVYTTLVRPVRQQDVLAGFVIVTRDITTQRQSEVGLAESEKRYRSVYEAARDAIIMLDRNDGSVLDCNAAARRLYGYSTDDMLRLTIRELSDEPDRSMATIQSGVERVALQYHKRNGGTAFPVEISMSHFVHGGREVCTAFVQDISQRKVVEEALREGARLYRAVVEDQTELICRYSPDGTLSFVNRAYATFFGVDEDDVVDTRFFPKLAPDERRSIESWLKEAGPSRPVFDREQHVRRGDGEARWILWTNRAIMNPRGDVMEIQAVGRDVTDRKKAEQALSRATMEKENYRLNLEAIFRSIPDAIVSVDSDLEVIATNHAASELLGLERETAKGSAFESLVGDPGTPCISVLKQVLRTSKSVHGYEAELDLPHLGARTVELNCTPLVDRDKQHMGAVLVIRDVSRIADLEKRLHERHGFRGIIGRSSRMQEVYDLLEQLSSLESTVLILGESGTGKELIADALHYGGVRAGAPIVKVNCSALSESLLESELFGHVKGAFTGATHDKVGRIQAAQGGTLFLDEIGDISPLIQLKLLRFLEQKEYERVGESKTRSADVRILAATNVNLRQAVREGAFREDLYYRLNVMPVPLPPLRERQGDIPLLIDHFLEIFADQFNKRFGAIDSEVMDLFMSYAWPGNVRELRHILEHACILCPGGDITISHLRRDLVEQMRSGGFVPQASQVPHGHVPLTQPHSFHPQVGGPDNVHNAMPPFPVRPKAGKQAVLDALHQCEGNKAKAARQLGIHRATLYRKLKAWGLDG